MTNIKVIPKEVYIGDLKIADVKEIQIRNTTVRQLSINGQQGSVQIYHDILDMQGDLIASRDTVLDGEDYSNWGKSDDYIKNILLQFYGLEEFPADWIEPDGVHPPYSIGDKAHHNEEIWVSQIEDNIEEPTSDGTEWELYNG